MPWPDAPSNIIWPPFAYVPGVTARHAEDRFDGIKASVTADMPAADLHHTSAFTTGLAYLDAGYFWECHEVLEAVWMQTADPSCERDMVQALIQLANARLKLRMGKPRAARRLCDMVSGHLARCEGRGAVLGLGVNDVLMRLNVTRDEGFFAL
ncbi:hypothetical protein ROLI_036870 [Roseobacter fucihabitans]|uniref:DUF309 domain-containing protein n=1 Tax=Roseobacter fucihabitans TaxID=1537242 RepID=A0ABZ2C138_9RHOB|nr:DUF309 domain-containing protein [Roseobacter litoralis]MBC6966340.1 hypothetical protein [Roseobacter litoralis]